MLNKSILKWSLMIFALLIAGNVGANAQKTDCTKKTDKEIVFEIYDQMKVKYADQISHVNVRIKDGTVTIEGWVNSKKARQEIEKLAKKIKCVKKVVNTLTIGKPGGCAAGYKECGGACIPEKEACNICLYDPMAPGCYSGKQ